MFTQSNNTDAATIMNEVNQGEAVLVDVRGDDEWNGGHAEGASHLSVDRILQGELPTKDTSIKVYLYCASGGRAGMAANYLKDKGFETENIGGLSDWKKAGGAVA